jgi:hypothetical protein
MAPKLYDVTITGSLVMRAPINTIMDYLNLHKDAVERIRRETEGGGTCEVFATRYRGSEQRWYEVSLVTERE